MKGTDRQRGHIMDLVFVLALFCVLAATSLMVVILGANVYQSTAEAMSQNYDARTSLTYITEKVRQNDGKDTVKIGEIGGAQALFLEKSAGEGRYRTCLYTWEGELRELVTRADAEPDPALGQTIMKIGSLTFAEPKEGLLRVTVTDTGGSVSTAWIALRS